MIPIIGKSLHINWDELACKDGANHTVGTPYPIGFINDGRVIELVVMFERIRQHFGSRPITINSAYRTKAYNKKIGGAPNSQHLHGKALDLQPPSGMDVTAFFNELKLNSHWMGFRGLGKYKTFVHCDIRDSKELIIWDLSNG